MDTVRLILTIFICSSMYTIIGLIGVSCLYIYRKKMIKRNGLKILKKLGYKDVKVFQRDNGLIPDGIIGERTYRILKSAKWRIKWNFRETKTVIVDGTAKKTRPRAKDYLIVDGLHPAIVSEELFEMAQEKKGKNPKIRQALTIRNIFAGLLFCGKCEKAIVYKDDKRTPPRLVCNDQVHCGNVSVLYSDIIDRVQKVLKDSIEDFTVKLAEDTSDTAKAHESQIQELSKRLELLKEKEVKQWDLYSQGAMPPEVFEKLNEQLKADKETTSQALEYAQKNAPTPQEYQERICRFTDALNALNDENLSAEKKNALLKACIDRMEYTKEKGTRWDVKPIILDIKLRL